MEGKVMKNQDYILRESQVVYKKYKKVKSLKFTSPGVVNSWFRKLKNEVYEKLIAIYLNSSNEVIAFNYESEGDVDQAVIYPRKVAKNSLLNNATRIILAHNHPSGNPKPSEHDIEITKKLKSALETIEIELLDHIIIGAEGYYSFREHSLI
jgi:DNA repair protein RadC